MIIQRFAQFQVINDFSLFFLLSLLFLYYIMGKQRKRSRSRSRSREKSSSRKHHDRKKDHHGSESQHSSSMEERHEPKWKTQQTKTLKVESCTDRQAAERALIDVSIRAGTSVPDQVQFRENSIFAKYPSIQVSSTIITFLTQKITINAKTYAINFFPFCQIDLNVAYDWYCDRCDYKNFSRRNKCYRCQSQKSDNCKLNYGKQSKPPKNHEDNINALSLMVRGPIIMEAEEEDLLDLFESYASVKDIRMIKNRVTDQKKDFAFVEFFNAEDAAVAYNHTTGSDFRVRGEKVSVMYSRNKSDDDYAKPLPYERKDRRRDRKEKKKEQPVQNYYNRQRQLQIQQQKQRPLITLEQLKEKHEQQMKKNLSGPREMTEQQSKRRQAELMAKQWQKQARMQNSTMYICVVCRKKFKGEDEMKGHEAHSELHKFNMERYQLSL